MPAISDVNDLQDMNLDLAGTYWLANDIDASATVGWWGGAGFIPIGASATPFTGTFDGREYTITGLFINRPATDYIGLFGRTRGATIQDVILADVNTTGDDYVGSLIGGIYGDPDPCTITNCSSSGTVSGGDDCIGGLIGEIFASTITSCFSSCTVTGGDDYIGGFAGRIVGEDACTITSCYATGNVDGDGDVGGFSGEADECIITKCYAVGTVTATGTYVGGFVGYGHGGTLFTECYAAGDVTGTTSVSRVGGFAGELYPATTLTTDCYARGDVAAALADKVGGFVGSNDEAITTNCYSTGSVTGSGEVGGFVGDNDAGTITDCFWDVTTSGEAASDGGTGKTTSEMKTRSTFTDAGWDFIIIWAMNGITNDGYPFFWAMPPEDLPDAPRETILVEDKITLESIRNVEMAAMGRFFIDEEGKAAYKSRHARNL